MKLIFGENKIDITRKQTVFYELFDKGVVVDVFVNDANKEMIKALDDAFISNAEFNIERELDNGNSEVFRGYVHNKKITEENCQTYVTYQIDFKIMQWLNDTKDIINEMQKEVDECRETNDNLEKLVDELRKSIAVKDLNIRRLEEHIESVAKHDEYIRQQAIIDYLERQLKDKE